MRLTDTHAHLDFTDDKDGWIERAKEAGVGKIINVGTSIEGSKKSVEIAEKFSTKDLQIFASVGIHPQDGQSDIKKLGSLDRCIEKLKEIAKSSRRVVAVGECGLDYYLKTTDKDKKFQRKLFVEQIKLAQELDLPLIIHCRNGWSEIFVQLSGQRTKGVFHTWTGDWQAAKKALGLGFYISFSGIVTFKNAPLVQEVAKKVPLEKMLLETDSPFLSPEPYRGRPNEPKNVIITARFLADLRGVSLDTIGEVTSRNAEKLFGI